MATVLRSNVAAILAAVKAQLIADGVALEDEIWIVRKRRGLQVSFSGDKQFLLSVGGYLPGKENDGGGRLNTWIRRRLRMQIRTSLLLDEAEKDETRLLTDATGHYAIEDAVLNCLQDFLPEDTDGNWLLNEPMRLNPSGDAEQEAPNDSAWTQSVLEFEICYTADLSPLT